jgi:3-oxoacyl-[acyl-carrier-protein] synthase-3
MAIRAVAVGCGAYLPSRIVTNDELSKALDTSDEWIAQRTGIHQRHIAAEGEVTSDMGLAAARQALEMAGIGPNEIDLIICATSTPDETFPATATRIQARLGCTNGAALSIADGYIRLGKAKTVLVVGAETFSRILDWEDRSTCVLFGDGAGALLLRAEPGNGDSADRGLLSTHIHSDGRYHDALYVDGGPSLTGTIGHLRMEGKEVFRHAVVRMAEAIDDALEANGLSASDIDWLVPHQANLRIIDAMGRRFDLPKERVVVTVDRHANTSAASIPLALSEAVGDGRIKVGDLIVMEAMGGGFTWGSALLRW